MMHYAGEMSPPEGGLFFNKQRRGSVLEEDTVSLNMQSLSYTNQESLSRHLRKYTSAGVIETNSFQHIYEAVT